MADEQKDVQDPIVNDTIDKRDSEDGAGDGTPEDTLGAYKSIIEQQKKQIDTMLDNQKSLQNQISVLIRNGASPNGRNDTGNNVLDGSGSGGNDSDHDSQEPYVTLAELGSEIGKRDFHSHNVQED